ncbi:hypothetical protein KCU91_g2025, partial [Aureobasidium melanogenum]
MSEPFSDKEKSNMDTALQSSRSAMPFIEEDDDVDTKIKSEVKNTSNGCQSPLFEPQISTKRTAEDDMFIVDFKKPKIFAEPDPRAYGGGPVRPYTPGTPYNYLRHEPIPELEINSERHLKAVQTFRFNAEEVVIPAVSPYKDEDKTINDAHGWFELNKGVPVLPPTRFAIIGRSGSGKTSTLNSLLGKPNLAEADAAEESVTQTNQLFNHAIQNEAYVVEVLFLNGRAIKSLIVDSINALTIYVARVAEGEPEELGLVRSSAETGKQVVRDLFFHEEELESLDDAEEFLEKRNIHPQDDGKISDETAESLYQELRQRAASEGINLDERSYRFAAKDVPDLRAKTARFSERGGFAPIVSVIRTKLYSPLLAQGIEIADLPGSSDINEHLRKTSHNYSKHCQKVIFVADSSRCMSTPETDETLMKLIKRRFAENVCLVEVKATNKWNKVERAQLEAMEKSLKIAQCQMNDDDETIQAQAKTEAENIERQIFEHRIKVRVRYLTDHYHQKKFQKGGKIRVILVSNICFEMYMLGQLGAKLPYHMTGIQELREWMCETPSRDGVLAFARRLENFDAKLQRIMIWTDGPKMPPQEAAMVVFEQYARWNVEDHMEKLNKALKQYKVSLNNRCTSIWVDGAQKKMDDWSKKYPARTQGVFMRQGGRHIPKLKSSTDEKPQKPPLVSWVEDLMTIVEDDVTNFESLIKVLDNVQGSINESISRNVDMIFCDLEKLDTIAGASLDGVSEVFGDERKSCIRDIDRSIIKLRKNLRLTAQKSVTDEPYSEDAVIFVKVAAKIFKRAFKRFPPKTKNVTKERMGLVQNQILGSEGPYRQLIQEISNNLSPLLKDWAAKVNAHYKAMHKELRDALFKSFEGKKMSDARRQEVGPAIKSAMEKARVALQAELGGYTADKL